MKNKFYIYAHYRKTTGEIFYVGKGQGKRAYQKNDGRSNYWHNIVKKDGYTITILHDNLTEDEAFQLEKDLIKKYGRNDLGLGPLVNMTDGGDGVSGYVYSEEQIEQMRNRSIGELNHMFGKSVLDCWIERYGEEVANQMWEEQREIKRVQMLENNPHNNPEVRKKIGQKLKNRVMTKEHRKNLSISRIGKCYLTEEQKQERSINTTGSKNPNSILTENDVRYIRSHYKPYSKQFGMKQLAQMFNVSVSTIDLITRNLTWCDVK